VDLMQEGGKAGDDFVDVFVVIEVVFFDVEGDADFGMEVVKAAIVFAGFDDEEFAGTGACRAAELWAGGTDNEGGVFSGGQEDVGGHGGGGGFAMRAGDGDALF